jgi:hypothetical protein
MERSVCVCIFQGALQGCACELACEGEMQHQLCVLLSACDLAFAQEQQLQWLPEHHLCSIWLFGGNHVDSASSKSQC